jgi:two-component system CheB/CheR fusion protein
VKQLAEMHGGRIEAASEGVGQGARFRLWLPENPSPSVGIAARGSVNEAILKGLKVLLVDDSVAALEAFRELLEIEGASVQAALNGKLALAAVAETPFDLILSDISMPDMDGYELIAELRQSPHTATVPAIALTGFGRGQDVAKALSLGYDAHLSKPVSLSALLTTIGSILRR